MALRFLNSGYFAGKVGIGTESPHNKVEISTSTDGDGLLLDHTIGSNGRYTGIYFKIDNNTADAYKKGGLVWERTGSYNEGRFHFLLNNENNANNVDLTDSKFTILSTGNVGIGTTTPNAKLDVQGTQGQLFSVTDDLSGEIFAVADISGVPIMTVNSSGVSYFNGNVGIGTNSPNYKLTVTGDAGFSNWIYASKFYPTSSTTDILMQTGVGRTITLDPTSTGKVLIPNGNVGIGTTSIGTNERLLIKTSVDNSVTQGLVIQRSANTDEGYINYNGGGFQFRSTDGDPIVFGQVSNERVRIKDDGNVGINTTSPDFKLDVDGTFGVSDLPFNTDSVSVLVADETIGADLVTNGDFATDSDWTKGTGTTISGGAANFSSASAISLYQNIGTQTGNVKVEFTVTSYTSGTLNVYSGSNQNVANINVSANALGTYSVIVDRTSGNVNIIFGSNSGSNFTGSIDNVSVKQITSASNQIQKRELGTGAFGPTPVGAYLPLAGGTMTGNIEFANTVQARFMTSANTAGLKIQSSGTNSFIDNEVDNLFIRQKANDKDIILQCDDGSGGISDYLTLDGSTTHAYFSNPGNVGIGANNPGAKFVVTDNTSTAQSTVVINHSRSDANEESYGLFMDVNLSGADTTTADRTNRGIWLDLDSSADGDASNEHRIRGIESDVRFSGFSDVVQSVYGYAESNNNTGKTAILVGVNGQAVHDSNSTNGGVSNMYGVMGTAYPQDLGDVDNAFGGYFAVLLGNNRGNADFGVSKGVEGHINIDKAAALNYGTMIAVSGVIDNNEGTVPNFGAQYLFKGDYQGTKGSNTYGIYTEGDKHYFDGNLGIGTTGATSRLTVKENGITTKIATATIGDTVAGASLTLRGGSPTIYFDRTGADPQNKILMDNAGLEFKTGTLDVEGDVDFKINPDGSLQLAGSANISSQNNTDIDTGAEVVAQVAHATYTAAFFDFVVKKGTNVRSGTVYACHNGDSTPLVEFTETSTQDLGDTSDVVLSVDISGTNMRLIATVASDDWSVKSLIRAI